MTWAIQDAKSRFSEVIGMVAEKGPQVVTRRGEPVVVMITYGEYVKRHRKVPDFVDALLACPRSDKPIEFERDHGDFGREIDL